MSEELFDLADEYEVMLNQGLRLSGETKEYFAAGRVRCLAELVGGKHPVRRILDFGCGTGGTSVLLAEAFPNAEVVGIDTAVRAIEHANSHFGSPRLSFVPLAKFAADYSYDLCYVNGVFHHIEPADRPEAVDLIRRALCPGGHLGLFENNPWNPGTRMVMRRIPFDRDAQTLSPPMTRRLLSACGLTPVATRFLFFYPRALKALRPTEKALSRVPLGAQYVVLGRSDASRASQPALDVTRRAA